jgi:hypothetical protein
MVPADTGLEDKVLKDELSFYLHVRLSLAFALFFFEGE